MLQQKKQLKGFTLLETLIALAVVTVGALAVFALMNRTLLVTERNKQSVVGVNLAREGLELVRSLRDSSASGFAVLQNGNWIIDSEDNYNLVTSADTPQVANCSNCFLYITGGQYSHTVSPQATSIRRLINISDGSSFACSGTCEKIVTVYVLPPGSNEPYVLQQHFTDWK